MRIAEIKRTTAETDISLELNLDGTGAADIQTGCGFLDHMLTLFARHGRFDLNITCQGDTYVDDHHTVEDIGIALGQAFAMALGDKKGIRRYCPVEAIWAMHCKSPPKRSAVLTRSWWRNSGWASSVTPAAPFTFASLPAPIPITSSKAPSNPPDAA